MPSPGPRPSQSDGGQPALGAIFPLHNPDRISSLLFQRSWLPEKNMTINYLESVLETEN